LCGAVAPYTGAWIETAGTVSDGFDWDSSPLHGGVD